MSLLPRARTSPTTRHAYGGALPEDPLELERRRKLAEQAAASQQAAQQAAGLIAKAPAILAQLGVGGGAAAGATGAAGAATGLSAAAGPIGLALAAGSLVGGKLRQGQTDGDGFRKTGTGNQIVSTVADVIDPIGSTMKAVDNLKRDDLTGLQKIGSFVPGAGALLTADADAEAKKKALAEKSRRDAENSAQLSAAGTSRVYGGLPGGYARGGLLPPAVAKQAPVAESSGTYRNKPFAGYLSGVPTMKPRAASKSPLPKQGNTSLTESIVDMGIGEMEPFGTIKDLYDVVTAPTRADRGAATLGAVLPFVAGKNIQAILNQPEAKKGFDILNLNDRERIELYKRYGPGGLDKWEADGYQPLDQPRKFKPKPYGAPRSNAKGGLLPGKFLAGGELPGDPVARGNDAANWLQQNLVRATRAVLPLNAAMSVQDLSAGLARKYLPASSSINRTPRVPLTERDLNPAQMQAMRRAAGGSNPDTREITYGSYGRAGDSPDAGGIYGKLTNPVSQMVSTVGGAMLSPDGRRVTDSFDFGGTDAVNHQGAKRAGATFLSTLKNQGLYEGVRYAEGELGSTVDGQGIPVNINLGGAYKPKPRPQVAAPAPTAWAKGGLLPKSVIAHGALHSETNQHAGHATAGKRGIPVLDASGVKLAEVERDEWTLADFATKKLESLRNGGSVLALGRHVQRELLTNTTPSPRYAKRLLPVK